jgi:hypothetical protein
MASPYIQFRAPDTLADRLRMLQADDESLGLTARWVIEQYLSIVDVARSGDLAAEDLVRRIIADDYARLGVTIE